MLTSIWPRPLQDIQSQEFAEFVGFCLSGLNWRTAVKKLVDTAAVTFTSTFTRLVSRQIQCSYFGKIVRSVTLICS